MIDSLLRDARQAVRTAVRRPAHAAVVVLTLAIGIGVTTVIFTAVDGVLLRPLPYPEPDRIVAVRAVEAAEGGRVEDVAPGDFFAWRERTTTFAGLAAVEPFSLDYVGWGRPETFTAWRVSEDFFRVLGVEPAIGRAFVPEEYDEGGPRAVLFSHGVWQRRFGGDPRIVGSTVTLDGEPRVVVGVMPPGFRYREPRDMWVPRLPWSPDEYDDHDSSYLDVVGRLATGTTIERARADLAAVAAGLARDAPATNATRGVRVETLRARLTGDVRPALLVLMGAVVLVLLVACGNVAGLTLAHGIRRRRELAVRAAVGASPARLARRLLVESVVLAAAGGLVGLALAYGGVELVAALAPPDLPRIDEVAIDARVLAFAFGVTLLSVVLFGLVPALRLSRPDLRDTLGEESRSTTEGGTGPQLRRALVVGEIALALTLAVGAGLLVRSFLALTAVDPGFDPRDRIAAQVFLYGEGYDDERRRSAVREIVARLESHPGIASAAAVSALPFSDANILMDIEYHLEGTPEPADGRREALVTMVTPGYFETMGIDLGAGREFGPVDGPDGVPVAIVNEAWADGEGLGADAVGRRLVVGSGEDESEVEVVGVVADVLHTALDEERRPEIFLPHAQAPFGSMSLVVRVRPGGGVGLPDLSEAVWQVLPDMPIYAAAGMEEWVGQTVAERRFYVVLMTLFGGIALLLAVVGVYGLVSYDTSRRTHEIGIRMALGAKAEDVLRMILGRGALLVAAGVAIGLVGAIALTRFLTSMMYGVRPTDPLTFVAVALGVAAVALAASWLPARRATRVEPAIALRYE